MLVQVMPGFLGYVRFSIVEQIR